ncbi:MAG: MmgE/PrpD family protein [Sedimentibacter sp.]|uniref:MmgE/PrpD family protein n=1 Tax=Sedimentibacter sp. TaxID=1960295 RepID=UPI0031585C50
MNEIIKLAEYISEFNLDKVPQNVLETTKICVLDSFAAAVGASQDETIKGIIEEYQKIYRNDNGIYVWGHEVRLPVVQAAFINAMMGHKLELDDVHTGSKTHIGTVVVPTALCLAQQLNSSGKDFLEAVICGYEVMSRIGMGFGVSSHRNKGWHVTSTAGTFGAAAAAAKLMKLSVEETAHALGMAGTQSFGLWAFLEDSASSKILHPARAAASGIEACFLAKAGMTGPVSILSARDGSLFRAMSDEYDLTLVTKDLGTVYEILNVDNKPYPCCRSTHCAIDSALKLRENHSISADDVKKVVIDTYLVGYKQCGLTEGSRNPKTPTEAKFSTPYTFADAMVNGSVVLEHFSEDFISDTNIKKLSDKVEVRADDEFTARYPNHWGCRTTVTLKDGSSLSVEVQDATGSVCSPVSENDIKSKAAPLLRVAYDENNVIDKILDIEKQTDMSLNMYLNN